MSFDEPGMSKGRCDGKFREIKINSGFFKFPRQIPEGRLEKQRKRKIMKKK
jgi:hypothetical protein